MSSYIYIRKDCFDVYEKNKFIIFWYLSINFQFLEVDSTEATIGLITENLQNSLKDLKLAEESSFVLTRKGKIFIDGVEKATVMPEFSKSLKVSNNQVNCNCSEKYLI